VGRRVRSNLWSDVTGLRTGPSAKTRPRWVPHCPPCPQSTYVWLLASPYLLNSAAFLWPARARTPPPPTSPRPSWCSADSARSRGTRRAGSRARTPRGSTTGCTRAGARSARSWYVRVPCYPPCQDTTWEYDWVYESWRSLGSQLVCAGPLLPSVPGHHVGVRLGVRERARTPRGSTTGCTRAGARSARSWYVRVPCYPQRKDPLPLWERLHTHYTNAMRRA
jgi:hypothetical protein